MRLRPGEAGDILLLNGPRVNRWIRRRPGPDQYPIVANPSGASLIERDTPARFGKRATLALCGRRQANAAMKTMPNKTDRNDARALAQIIWLGWYRQVHVRAVSCRLWHSVARRTVLKGP